MARTIAVLLILSTFLVLQQTAPVFAVAKTNQIVTSYEVPGEPKLQSVHDKLKALRVLEKVQEFLSPVRLPRQVGISLKSCDGEAIALSDADKITICYEVVEELLANMPEKTTPAGIAPIDTVIGPFFDIVLHEFGHTLFYMLDLPILGREEGAADQVATYVMLQLGKSEAHRLISGVAHSWWTIVNSEGRPRAMKEYADVHGTPEQRFYNLLCMAYGADTVLFGDLVTKGYLPKMRAEGCELEYHQFRYAFDKMIGPHIDPDLAKKVLDRAWLGKAVSVRPSRRHPSDSKEKN